MKRVTLESLIVETAQSVRPPERLTVTQAAEKYRYLNNPGSYVGPYRADMTPYMIEPQDVLASLEYQEMIFVSSSQAAKTEAFVNWLTHAVKCDPGDMMLVAPSNNFARDFSIRRVDRLHVSSREVGAMLAPGKQNDNKFDKHYRNGMMLNLSWPTPNELSGKPIPRMFLTDYDRMDQDVGGEGSPFALSRARMTTFKQFGMCAAESSPGFLVQKPNWIRKTRHEAPPTTGILELYNGGDRRRWYWQCVSCREWFEPHFGLMQYPKDADPLEAGEAATLRCPYCEIDYCHEPANGLPGKADLNRVGRWVPDGAHLDEHGNLLGNPTRSIRASFWLKGVAAAFAEWKVLVSEFMIAERAHESSGSEEALKTHANTRLGEPYTPKSFVNDRTPESIKAKALPLPQRYVPEPVRFLIATVDVQPHRFVVQVHGIALNKDVYVIDRFDIKKSKRKDEDGERRRVDSGAYLEDWKLLYEQVITASYPLADDSGRRMQMKLVLCDSGGKAGTTEKAYDFVRWLRSGRSNVDGQAEVAEEGTYDWEPGMSGRFKLLKGGSTKTGPRVQVSHPDSERQDRHAGARGEIPVLILNTNELKNMVDHRLNRTDPGGRFVFPDWLDDNFFIEMTVEVRDPQKGWINPKNFRNETWDLLAYAMAATLTHEISLDYIREEKPPSWAAEWDRNDMVFNPTVTPKPFEAKKKSTLTLEQLAERLA